jgi:hypothetical protein
MKTITVNCAICNQPFERKIQRGRPATKCEACRAGNESPSVATAIASINQPIKKSIPQNEDVASLLEEKTSSADKFDKNFPYLFRVVVGNLGIAYGGDSEAEAKKSFRHYSKVSQNGFGQVGFERVALWQLDIEKNQYQVLEEFLPDRSL